MVVVVLIACSSLKTYLYYYYNKNNILRISNTLNQMRFYLYVTIRDECIIFPLVPFSGKKFHRCGHFPFPNNETKNQFKTFLPAKVPKSGVIFSAHVFVLKINFSFSRLYAFLAVKKEYFRSEKADCHISWFKK